MKLTILIMTICLMQVTAATKAQITLNEKAASLQKVLKSIGKQSGYDFVYSDNDFKGTKPVNLKLENVSIDLALKACFVDQPLIYEVKDKTVVVRRQEDNGITDRVKDFINAIDVKGKVVDANGHPLSGASITVKGTNKSVATDSEGNFSINNVADDAILVITFIGFQPKEISAKRDLGRITLEISTSKLDEVQIQAYGITSRRLSTGNISTVKAADIEKQPINNPLYALQGRVSGVIITPTSGLPGAPISIQIRGRNTLNPDNKSEPLYVIDGLPYGNQLPTGTITPGLGALAVRQSPFNFINPNDIESIDILKDADATSIYGSRGSNGVILITTKKGSAGTSKIDINAQSGFSQVGHKMDLMNTQEYLQMRLQAVKNDGYQARLNNPLTYGQSFPDLLFWDANSDRNLQQELIGRTAQYKDFQGSFSGGNNLVQYLFGGNYHKETTVFPGKNYDEKISGRFNLNSSSANQRFRTTLTASYLVDNSQFPSIDFTSSSLFLPPNFPAFYQTNGNLNWAPNPNSGLTTEDFFGGNPLAGLERKYEMKQTNFLTAGTFSYRLFDGLIVKSVIGYSDTRGDSFQGAPATASDPYIFTLLGNNVRSGEYNSTKVSNWNFNPQLNYSKNFRIGSLDLLLGSEFQSTTTNRQSNFASGFMSDELIRNLQAGVNFGNSVNSSQYKYSALFFRASYNYLNKYLININARRDGSSRFAPGKQFGNFGSIGAAWIFSEEKFLKRNNLLLSFGKLKFSYGTSGNDGSRDYQYLEQYQVSGGFQLPYQGTQGFSSLGLFNNDFHWETTKKIELGLDLGFFEDRILLQSSIFRNRSNNQLINYPYPRIAGFGNVLVNSPAQIQNSGIEVNLDITALKQNAFSWKSSVNFTINRNKLLSFPNLENTTYATQFEVGQPFSGTAYAFNNAGVNPTTGIYQFLDINGNTVVNPTNSARLDGGRYLRIMTAPKFYGGFQNNLRWKGLTLEFLLQFTKQMGTNPDLNFGTTLPGGRTNLPISYNQTWKLPGDQSVYQKLSTTSTFRTNVDWARQSDLGYVDASFIRLKNISLSYELPNTLTQKLKIRDISIFAIGQNVLTLTNYKGFDPETQSVVALPPLRTFSFGVKAGF